MHGSFLNKRSQTNLALCRSVHAWQLPDQRSAGQCTHGSFLAGSPKATAGLSLYGAWEEDQGP